MLHILHRTTYTHGILDSVSDKGSPERPQHIGSSPATVFPSPAPRGRPCSAALQEGGIQTAGFGGFRVVKLLAYVHAIHAIRT